jgi:hypothetical protein
VLSFFAALTLLASPANAQSDFKKSYVSDMKAFVDHAQANYPFFDLKGIRKDWKATSKRLEKAAKKCKNDADFMNLVDEGVACLRDAHMYVTETKVKMPRRESSFFTGVSFMPATEDRVVIMFPPSGKGASLKTGQVVLTINGKDARKVLEERAEETWEKGGSFSSLQRARFFEYRYGLSGESGDKFTLVCLDGKKKKTYKLSCRAEKSGWPHTYNLPKDLKQVGKSFYYSKLESGVGYMYLRRVDSSITEGMTEALANMTDVSGWIVDMRGNSGGGYNSDLTDQIKAIKDAELPVAVITDAGCISAGETLARDFVNIAEAQIFGTVSAGSSSSKKNWTFPSGIATVKFSTRSRSGLDGKVIEFYGITPHEITEVVPEEALAGENSSIKRAEEYLLQR